MSVLIVSADRGDIHAPSGAVIERAIRRIGMNREMFHFCEPRDFVPELGRWHPKCILALGNDSLQATTGLAGPKLTVAHLSGYVLPSPNDVPVVPCFSAEFMRMGHMNLLGVLMRCLRLAVQVAQGKRKVQVPDPARQYALNATVQEAAHFADVACSSEGYVAYDIETMYSNAEETAEEHFDDIRSIQFSLASGSGIYFPWRGDYIGIAKLILANDRPKIGWNNWYFDDPLLRDNGCEIGGKILDLMWAWHHSQPDLPRGLQFAAAMQGQNIYDPTASWPWPWKHLDAASPQFYGIVDVDVLQWMVSYV